MYSQIPMGHGPRGITQPEKIADAIVDENGIYRPRHAADDYEGIAERLKDLGYRGWITG